MITTNTAKALELKNYGLDSGCSADMVLLDTYKVRDAIIDLPDKIFVIKKGKVVAETTRVVKTNF